MAKSPKSISTRTDNDDKFIELEHLGVLCYPVANELADVRLGGIYSPPSPVLGIIHEFTESNPQKKRVMIFGVHLVHFNDCDEYWVTKTDRTCRFMFL